MFIKFYYSFILRKQHLFEKKIMSGMRDVFLWRMWMKVSVQ